MFVFITYYKTKITFWIRKMHMDTLKPKNSKLITFTVRAGFFIFWAILAHSGASPLLPPSLCDNTIYFKDNCFYSDMENKTICGPAFQICASYRCNNKSALQDCIYSDIKHKMTEVVMLIKNISCRVSSKA